MDLRQLTALVAVADHRSFSAAARALHTVQSNVSTHVARLERELGAPLVDRATGDLTDEGVAVVTRARRIHVELAAIDADVAALRDEIRGTIRIGMIGTTARWLVPQLLEAVGERYPAVRLIVIDATTTSLVPQIAEGRLDLALVQLPVDHPDIEGEPIFVEEAVIIAPPGHPLASAARVDTVELAQHKILISPPGVALRDMLDDAARRAGVTLQIAGELDGVRLLASMAFQGVAPAVVPATAVAGIEGDYTVVHLVDRPQRLVGLAFSRRTSLSALARTLKDLLVELIADQADNHLGVSLVDRGA